MGLRHAALWGVSVFLLLASGAAGAPYGPTVFAVAWEEVPAQFFPHPALCVGDVASDRQRLAGPGFLFDPDGCGERKGTALHHIDLDGSGAWSFTEPLYLQPVGSDRIEAGALRVTTGAPEPVRAQDRESGAVPRAVGSGAWDFVDLDGSGRWSAADVAYLDRDGNGFLTPGDLSVQQGLRLVALGTPGMSYPLVPTAGGLCFLDDDGSGSWTPNEPVYLVKGRSCGHVAVGDLRVVATRGLAPGSSVLEAHVDYRNPLMAFEGDGGAVAIDAANRQVLFDLDGSGTATATDRVATVGLPVANASIGAPLEASSAWAYLDMDGTRTASAADAYYLDRDANGRTSSGDVRFTRFLGHPIGSFVRDGDPDAVAPLPPPARPEAPATAQTGPETEAVPAAKESPGPHLLLVMMLAMIGSRRLQGRKEDQG